MKKLSLNIAPLQHSNFHQLKIINLLLIFSGLFSVCNAQIFDNTSFDLFLGYGYVLQTNDFISGENADSTNINSMKQINFQVSKTVDGKKAWHHLYDDFRYGVGFSYGHFNYSKHLNNPFSFYAFAGFSPIKKGRFTYRNELALGLSGIWDKYDSLNNPMNIAVSMPIEVYVHINYQFLYNFNPSWQGFLALSFTHFSNGAVTKPNKGINIITPHIGICYTPKEMHKYGPLDTLEKKKEVSYLTNVYYGVHSDYMYKYQSSGSIIGLQFRVLKNLSYKYDLGLGADITYNNAIGRNDHMYLSVAKLDTLSFWEKTDISLFLSFNYNISRISVILEPSIYLVQPEKHYSPLFYQRIGLRYTAKNQFFIQVALRAYNFSVADYVEWGVGYSF